jgi:hypothetical protein
VALAKDRSAKSVNRMASLEDITELYELKNLEINKNNELWVADDNF